MAESLLERSARRIDESHEGPRSINPLDGSFHETADGLAMVCRFSHIWTLDTGDRGRPGTTYPEQAPD